jgi:hypothetical protein
MHASHRPLACAIAALFGLAATQAGASSFVYEGRLDDRGAPASGRYDIRLTAYPDPVQGSTLSAPMEFPGVDVREGRFRLEFDLPLAREEGTWLELGVRDAGTGAAFAAIAGRAKATAAPLVGACWSTTGDSGVNPAVNFLGTTDAQPLVLRTGNAASLRLAPSANLFGSPPLPATSNLVGGSVANSITAGVRGATIAGGGTPGGDSDPDYSSEGPNRVTDHYGTVSGGFGNTAGNGFGTTADAPFATVGGGQGNVSQANASTIAGGAVNFAFGEFSTIAGGIGNVATGAAATAGGGLGNCAGGDRSWAAGEFAATRLGQNADDSACPGVARTADDNGDEGTFVWADSPGSAARFVSTGPNQFLVRARGGLALNGTPPDPSIEASVFGNDTTSVGGFANLFMRQAGATTSGAGILVSVGSAGNASGDNNAAFYVDQYSPLSNLQQRRLSVEPSGVVRVDPSTRLEFGSATRQMLNLWGDVGQYGIGVQSDTLYMRTANNGFFAWFQGGTHTDAALGPGAGGTLLMSLTPGPGNTTPTGYARATLFTNVSDRAAKTGFSAIDPLDVLQRVVALPLSRWSYRSTVGSWHIGPMAQDFRAAFGLGDDDRTIATVDADGVALAAIQGLNARLEAERDALAAEVARLDRANAALREDSAALRSRLEAIEARLGGER